MSEAFKEFEKTFGGGAFPDEEFQQILRSSNTMLSLRFGASPHYNAYLKALMSVKKSENPEMRFRDMHRIFDAMLAEPERRVNDILSFLNFLPPFFERRTLRDSELGTSWTALTDAYRFRYDNAHFARSLQGTLLVKHHCQFFWRRHNWMHTSESVAVYCQPAQVGF